MKIEIGKKYKLTMPATGKFINITRDEALKQTDGSGTITIEETQHHRIWGDIARIEGNRYWVSFDHLAKLHKIIKYNKDK